MAVLEVNNIQKNFGKTEVLKGISFSLEKGEVLSEKNRAHEIPLESNMKIVYILTGAVDKSIEVEETETEAE